METRANYITVGIFTVLLFLGALFFVVWIGKSEFRKEPDTYAIYFDGSVSGLQEGAKVLYRGVSIGSVRRLSIDPKDVEKVLVLIDVYEGAPIKEDAVAELEMLGVTGLSVIQITGGTKESPTLEKKLGEEYPVIQSSPSKIEEIFNAAPELMYRVNALFNEENRKNLGKTLKNISEFTGTLKNSSHNLEILINELTHMSFKLNTFLETANMTLKDVGSDASLAAKAMAEAAQGVNDLLKDNKVPLGDFVTNGLFEFTRLVSQMRSTFETIGSFAAGLQKDPLVFLMGSPEKGYRIKDE